jgi:hypothetical protein
MSARSIGRPNPTSQARLQQILILLAAWNIVAFVFELLNTGSIEVARVDGILGGRALGGASLVLALAYIYAARNPMRQRVILWMATLEQFIAIFTAGFHWARDDITGGEAALPIVVAAAFLFALVVSLPRQFEPA